ncbi:hypothetical protein V6N12_039434 [Hibiscus sabdariffa]|uniref:Uncharacterized protein n=1 Tax=Hibiscus sabdariffa TaxID=183260 RepID=A0ABR2E0N9_9ROSI
MGLLSLLANPPLLKTWTSSLKLQLGSSSKVLTQRCHQWCRLKHQTIPETGEAIRQAQLPSTTGSGMDSFVLTQGISSDIIGKPSSVTLSDVVKFIYYLRSPAGQQKACSARSGMVK